MNVQTISDQELIHLYLSGNEACLEVLVKRHKKSIYTVIYLLVRDRSLAEDIFQETFIKIINTLRKGNEDQMIRQQTEHHVKELVKRLPEEQRQVLIMRHWGDMSFQEIADSTGVSINTALGRMRYALNNIRKMMEKQHVNL